jgi:L-2-hydroxyglutarate oxidase LhgO
LYFKKLEDVNEKLLREMIEESLVLGMEEYEMKRLKKRYNHIVNNLLDCIEIKSIDKILVLGVI